MSHSTNKHSLQGQAASSQKEGVSAAPSKPPQKEVVATVGLEEDQEEEDKEQDPEVEMSIDGIPDVS